MTVLRRTLLVLIVLFPLIAFAQADQAIVSVVDAPDPVIPGQTLTYTITFQNNGPNPAVNGGLNILLDANFTPTAATPPAGFSCTPLTQIMSCTNPSFAPGGPQVLTITGTVAAHLNNFPDGTLSSTFTTSGVTPDPNSGNNSSGAIMTTYNSPQMDLSVVVTDNPDPVFPDGNITYTIDVTNAGPDPATSVNFNSFNSGTLRYQSITIPSGWSCPSQPAVNGTPTFTCTNPSFAMGTSQFIVVVQADDAILGLNDGTVSTNFSVNGTGDDTNDLNNSETENTAYVTPDADMTISVTDSPDPVFPDGNITYTVRVGNTGPNTAPNAQMNVFNSGTLQFVSITEPAGWSCTEPAVGGTPTFNCTNPSFVMGASSTFTMVVHAEQDVLGVNDGTVMTNFSAGSGIADPDNSDNSETESTSYSTPDANVAITASDAPDPVTNGGTLTYTVDVSNAGPDAGPNAQMNASLHPSLTFQSLVSPAGWSCNTPAVDANGLVTCTKTSFANAETGNFIIGTKLVTAGAGGTISSTFTINTAAQDPVNTNNSVEVFTSWIGASSDLSITKNTLSTAAAQGSTITYTISTMNNGPDAATNVTVTDVLPSQLLFQSIVAPGGWSCITPAVGANGTVTCSILTFANGASANFTLTTTVAPNATGSIDNSASMGSLSNDPNGGNSTGSSGAVVVAGNADLSIAKSGNPGSATRGSTINYILSIVNAGPDPAASVTVTDMLPASLLFLSVNAPGWSCTTPAVGATGTVSCTIASLPLGPASIGLSVTVAPSATGSITNSASIAHSGTDGNAGNSSGSSSPTTVDLGSADLSISKSTTATTVVPGEIFAYTISLVNGGPDAASPVSISDTLPASLLFQSIVTPGGWSCTTPAVGATGTVACNAASLANGATANFTLNVRVADNATGTIANTVTVATDTPDPDSGDIMSTTTPLPVGPPSSDVSIVKTTNTTTVPIGTVFGYTIIVSNAGPSTATNVVVTDTLPAQLELVSATPSQGSCSGTTTVTCNLGSILDGANATINLQVRAIAAGGSVVNSASVDAAEGDPVGGDNDDDAPTIIVTGGPAEAQIPTLSEWALIALMGMLGLIAVFRMRT